MKTANYITEHLLFFESPFLVLGVLLGVGENEERWSLLRADDEGLVKIVGLSCGVPEGARLGDAQYGDGFDTIGKGALE